MSTSRDPYDVLGVKRTDPEETICTAFLAKVKEYHPDANNGQGDIAAFNEVRAAFNEILIERIRNQNKTINKCKHCNGKRICKWYACRFASVFRLNLKSGQCASCAK